MPRKSKLKYQGEPEVTGLIGRILAPIPIAADAIGVKRSKMYQLINDGEVETVHIGRSHLAVVKSLYALAERLRRKA